jgi:hypothetical protein
MILSSTTRMQGQRGCRPFPLHPNPRRPASASLRTISLDDSEQLLHNHHASVASLRLLFTFAPERRSASLRNRCSPSPEYPTRLAAELEVVHLQVLHAPADLTSPTVSLQHLAMQVSITWRVESDSPALNGDGFHEACPATSDRKASCCSPGRNL